MGHLPLVHSRIIQDEQRQSAASEGFVSPHLSTISWQHREQTASWDTSPQRWETVSS